MKKKLLPKLITLKVLVYGFLCKFGKCTAVRKQNNLTLSSEIVQKSHFSDAAYNSP